MAAVYHNDREVITVSTGDWLSHLKREAADTPYRRSRLCLHHDDQTAVHEMVIAFHRPSLVPPHRHHGKSESFHLIEGELLVVLFDDRGSPRRRIHMGEVASGRPFLYRLDAPQWHTLIPLSEFVVIHEVTRGPFRPEENEYAPWAPEEDAELARYLASLQEL